MRRSPALLVLLAAIALASEAPFKTATSAGGSTVSTFVGWGWRGSFQCPGSDVRYEAQAAAASVNAHAAVISFANGGDPYPVNLSHAEGYLSFAASAGFTCYLYSETSSVRSGGRAAQSLGSLSIDGGSMAISNFPGSQAVTGTFWPAAQVVTVDSGTVDARVSNFPATQAVSIASMPSTPVTGTFWQSTQPVSLATAPTTPVTGTFWQATQPINGTVSIDGGGAAGTLGVSVGNFPTAYTVSVDGGASGTLGVGQVGTWSNRIVGNAGGIVDAVNNAAAPTNVLAIGVDTIASGSQPSAATSPNVRRPTAGVDGVLFTKPFGPQLFNVGIESGSTSSVAVKAAPGAGLRVYVTDISIISSTMTGSGTWRLVTGTGGTCGTGTTTLLPNGAAGNRFWYPPAGDGGVSTLGQPLQMQFLTPIVAPANQDVCLVCVATNTCNAEINGYIAP